ncbi:MAG: hypothetical protein LBL24_08545 [Bacteroidales bacterium]|jgi:hypothetical protein|nr:hypothetical protein [Bacteroidales bacterium]
MNKEEKYAKLLALSVIYEKDERSRQPFLERIACRSEDFPELLRGIHHDGFREWVKSVEGIICHPSRKR